MGEGERLCFHQLTIFVALLGGSFFSLEKQINVDRGRLEEKPVLCKSSDRVVLTAM